MLLGCRLQRERVPGRFLPLRSPPRAVQRRFPWSFDKRCRPLETIPKRTFAESGRSRKLRAPVFAGSLPNAASHAGRSLLRFLKPQ